jgi:hypothetical protein
MVTGQWNTGLPDTFARRCLNTLFLNLWFTARSGKKDAFLYVLVLYVYTLPLLKFKEHAKYINILLHDNVCHILQL